MKREKRMRPVWLAAVLLAFLLSLSGERQVQASSASVSTWEELKQALGSVDLVILSQDITAESDYKLSVPKGRTVILNLQGYSIKSASGEHPIDLESNYKATLLLTGTGTIYGLAHVYGTMIMDGGTIQGVPGTRGSGVSVSNGTFVMNAGTICGHEADKGGGVYNMTGLVQMYGGEIRDNTASSGGGVFLDYNGASGPNRFEMYGGTITGNRALGTDRALGCGAGIFVYLDAHLELKKGTVSENTAEQGGGGIYMATVTGEKTVSLYEGAEIVNNSAASFGGGIACVSATMQGGTVKGNTSPRAGGIYCTYLNLSGAPYIMENTTGGDSPVPNNLYLLENDSLTVEEELSGGMVGVTLEGDPYRVFTIGKSPAKYFSSDNPDYFPVNDSSGEVMMRDAYLLSFDPNGGTGTMEPQKISPGIAVIIQKNSFSREGYDFDGWNVEQDGTGAMYRDGGKGKFYEPVTLYAQWTLKPCAVTFDCQGQGTAPAVQHLDSGEKAVKPSDPAAEGYTFGGWYLDAACEKAYDFDSPVSGSFTLYAKWTINSYTVTWKNHDGSVLETDENVPHGDLAVYDGETPVRESEEVHASYYFAGWDTEPDVVRGDTTYTARFESILKQFTVSFDLRGHGSAIKAQTVSYGQTVSLPNEPKAAGYDFTGWYLDEACTKAFDMERPVTGDLTLYAGWVSEGKPLLQVKAAVRSCRDIRLSWKAVPGADGYEIRLAYTKADYKKTDTIATAATRLVITEIGGERIKAGRNVKFRVQAYKMEGGRRKLLTKARTGFLVSPYSRKYTDPSGLSISQKKISLKVGQSRKILAEQTKARAKKAFLPGLVRVRFVSSNEKVAAVSKKGLLSARGKGDCSIYAVAANGLTKEIAVHVTG